MNRKQNNGASGQDSLNEDLLLMDLKAKNVFAEYIINASIDSMVALDLKLNIISWNETAALWSGKQADEVLGKPFFDVYPASRNTPGVEDAIRNALNGHKSFLPSVPGYYLDGYFETHFVPLKDDEGEVTGLLQIMHDVAHRIKAENQLNDLNHKLSVQYTALKHAHEEMATFGKIASHDLKEPLRKIYTFAEFIMVNEAGNLTSIGRSYFRSIQKSVQRMGLLTDDIVNFSGLVAGREQRVDLSVRLNEVIEGLQREIEQTGAIIHKASLPIISGHPKILTQLFKQLLSNSLKFRQPHVAPEIFITCEKMASENLPGDEAQEGEEYYCLSFKDNGIGFDPEFSTRIFGLFERLHPQGTYKGSGIGLAIALKAARMHEGFMRAENIPGEGSAFHCYIPVYKSL